jgi:hypothetical protein
VGLLAAVAVGPDDVAYFAVRSRGSREEDLDRELGAMTANGDELWRRELDVVSGSELELVASSGGLVSGRHIDALASAGGTSWNRTGGRSMPTAGWRSSAPLETSSISAARSCSRRQTGRASSRGSRPTARRRGPRASRFRSGRR